MAADSGKANREVVSKLISDMENFSEKVKVEMKKILVETINLEESWRDEQYKKFRETTVDMLKAMNQQLKVFDESTEKIKGKYKQLFGR